MKKRIVALTLALAMALSVFGGALAETREQQRYEEAKALLSAGKYEEARNAFEALGALNDAPLYALYATAILNAEKGNYSRAIVDMNALNGFADSALRLDYYAARALEDVGEYETAQSTYANMPDYLDCAARLAALPGKILARDYAKADALEKSGKLEEALTAFTALGSYSDSMQRADAIREKISARDYAKAEEMEKAGRLEDALEAFEKLGSYLDSAERAEGVREKIRAREYAKAEKAAGEERYADAYWLYKGLGNYLDSAERAAEIHDPAMYEEALEMADNGEYSKAAKQFASLGEYRDSAEKAYVLGVADFADWMGNQNGRVFVFRHHNLFGIVNYGDNLARPALYTELTGFDRGVARYRYKSFWGLVYPNLTVTENKWRSIGSFTESRGKRLAMASLYDGRLKYGYINEQAEPVIDVKWNGVSRFNANGVCFVVSSGRWGLADDTGKLLCEPVWETYNRHEINVEDGLVAAVPGTEDVPVLVRQNDKFGYVSWTGETLIEPKYEEARVFSDGLAAVMEDDLWGFVDRNGNYAIRPEYKEVTDFRNGRAEVWIPESGWHIIDKNNQRIYFTSSDLTTADSLMTEGKYMEAAEIYARLAQLDPTLADKSRDAWYQEAEKRLKDGNTEGAIEAFRKAGEYRDAADRIPRIHYALGETALTAKEWDTASAEFSAAGNYGNAPDRVRESYYKKGEALLEAGDAAGAIEAFRQAKSYRDAAERILKIHYGLAEAALAAGDTETALVQFDAAGNYSDAAERILKIHYGLAEAALAAGEWDAASAEFAAAGACGDAAERVMEPYYRQGEKLLAEKDYEGAGEAFAKAGSYQDAETMILECSYQKAEALYAAGDYTKAFQILKELKKYRDADTRIRSDENFATIYNEERYEFFRTIGCIVTYGNWEQDNNAKNGPEQIEWYVIGQKNGKALLLSVYGLETKPLNSKKGKTSWEKCSLHQWLNKDFLKGAFTKEEAAAIQTTTIRDQVSKTTSKDQVFLLDRDEVKTYVGDTEIVLCIPTARAAAGNPNTSAKDGSSGWWLRSLTPNKERAYTVVTGTRTDAPMVYLSIAVVRPAIWVDLDKLPQ